MDAQPQTPSSTRRTGVWVLTAVLAVVATALIEPGVVKHPHAAVPGVAWFVLLPLFALAEVVVIHLPTQREAHGHTLREVPAVLGLTFMGSQQYVSVYVVGAVVGLVLFARMRGIKLAFNAAMFAVEAAVGAEIYHLLLGGGDPLELRGWGAVLAAVLATDLISAAAVTTAISLTEASFDDAVLREALRSGMVAAFINTCIALLVATLVVVRPSALPLLGVVVVLLAFGYRVYASLARGHTRTQLLYQFVERTSSASAEDLVRTVLVESAELLHAEQAFLAERDHDGQEHLTGITAGEMRTTVMPTGVCGWWHGAYAGPPVRHVPEATDLVPVRSPHPAVRPRDGIAASLPAGGTTQLVLVVCDRSFEKETFGTDDIQVLEALSTHAGVALERARTVGHLRRVAEERAFESRHDPLTGLHNRRAFQEAIGELTRARVRDGRGGNGVVLLLDLDDFKDVNDTLGHTAGDRLLVETAERLRIHASGSIARLGGDEFAVLNPSMDLAEGLTHARELHRVLSQPVPVDGVRLSVSVSIGVARCAKVESTEDLLAQADVAMYSAKSERSGVAPYRPSAGDSTARRMTLASDLPAALSTGEIHPWFQPQAAASDGRVTGFEALVRWPHPVFGMIAPDEILAVAKRTGHLPGLTESVVRQALDARRAWAAAGRELDVAVNVTPRDISDQGLPAWVARVLREYGTPPQALVLEITESDAIQDTEVSLGVLHGIHDLGVQLSVDDFGTGYSSLAYLDQLPVDEVKIDQSFVFRLEHDATDATIVNATVRLAHDLGLRVVAEGVESELARAVVTDVGVDLYQGYGLARPLPPAEVLGWLVRWERGQSTRTGPAWVPEKAAARVRASSESVRHPVGAGEVTALGRLRDTSVALSPPM